MDIEMEDLCLGSQSTIAITQQQIPMSSKLKDVFVGIARGRNGQGRSTIIYHQSPRIMGTSCLRAQGT